MNQIAPDAAEQPKVKPQVKLVVNDEVLLKTAPLLDHAYWLITIPYASLPIAASDLVKTNLLIVMKLRITIQPFI